MPYAMSLQQDAKLRELYDEVEEKRTKEEKSILKKLPQNTKLILFAAVGFIIWQTYLGKIEKTNGAMLGLLIGAIIYFSGYSASSSMQPLTEQECRAKLHQQLREKQLYPMGQYYQIPPNIKIKQHPAGNLRFLDAKPWKWVLGVVFYDPDTKINQFYAAICNPYTGNLQGMLELTGGIRDIDFKDISIIPHKGMWMEKQYQNYMGKWPDKPK